jgi:hypothetical protein
MSTSSTVFWKNLGIKTVKRSRTIKNYNVKKEYTTLHRIGVDRSVAELIYQKSAVYGDQLFFNKLSRFFRQDPETVKTWLNASSSSEAFEKLYKLIDPNNLDHSKERLAEIDLILRFYKKGEGRHYEADYTATGALDFNPKSLIFNFNRIDKDAKYRYYGTAKLGSDLIYSIQKDSSIGPSVFKFIKLSIQGKKLKVALSMDSAKEYAIAKKAIEKWLQIYIDTPQASKSLHRFEQFITTGNSSNFVLSGVTYFDNNFKFTVSDIYNRPVNIGHSLSYKRKISGAAKKTETISLIRIFHKARAFARPISIRILSYKTGGIVGAISFIPNDRNLNDTRRKKLKNDFFKDFGISLNEFVTYSDLDELDIYKLLLEGTPQKVEQIDLRSALALSIYQSLVTANLFKSASTTEEQARICVNPNCPERFKTLWNKRFCSNCGQALINGKKLVTQTIDEWSVVSFIHSTYKMGSVTKLSNKLLTRTLSVAKIEYGENTAEFIPLNSQLKDHQLQVLRFRYPNLVIVTSQDNLENYQDQGLHAIRLYELVHNCKKGKSSFITQTLEQASVLHLKHTRTLCGESVARITNNEYYKKQNKISKYLGAELFEADCSTMLDYVFGNSLWLGAKHRGRSVPDGFTAFPLLGKKGGCFIWDTKYGEGKKVNMGKLDKNFTYIAAAKTNKSIIDNGGLKGFVFISNNKFPKQFEKKYLTLVKGTRIKLTFLSAAQLKRIVDQYRKFEKLMNNNDQAKMLFMQAMEDVFFNVKGNRKSHIIEDRFLDPVLQENERSFKRLKAGKPLTLE